MPSLDLYVCITSNLGALCPSVVVLTANPDVLKPLPPATTNKKVSQEVGDFLDDLEDKGLIQYTHDFINIEKINHYGLEIASKSYADVTIANHLYIHNLRPDRYFRTSRCHFNPYYPLKIETLERNKGLRTASWIGWFKRVWWIDNVWHDKYPQYNFINNRGVKCRDLALLTIEHGPVQNLHHIEFLKQIPLYWLMELQSLNSKYLFGKNNYYRVPSWWFKTFHTSDFTIFLTEEQRSIMDNLCCTIKKPKRFRNFLDRNKPCISTNQTF